MVMMVTGNDDEAVIDEAIKREPAVIS